ncbi:MAG: YdcF family protein, partial [Myxococcota bacterium]|nr:YdcF family protein [Myxococcota bacterium]
MPERPHSRAAQPIVEAIVVLGCRVRVDPFGRLRQEALARRIDAAALAYAQRGQGRAIVIASGGRNWNGLVEADVMARELVSRGVPEHALVRERCSLTTGDNARFTAAAMARRAITHAAVVTCEWHLPRAVALFRRAGISAEGVAAQRYDAHWTRRVWWRCRERALVWLQMTLALCVLAACSRRASPDTSASAGVRTASSAIQIEIEKAEDLRRARDVPPEAQRDRDPVVRRMAARAFARILDTDDEPLLRALQDNDDATIAWAAFGLGESCKGREERHERALVGRLASLDAERARSPWDARTAIVRALGRCGGGSTDQTLRACLRASAMAQGQGSSATVPRRRELDEAVVYALGDFAAKRGSLSTESRLALLDLAQDSDPLDAALYPFGRIEGSADDPLEPRLIAAARSALRRPGPARIYAVRALGRATGTDTRGELSRVLSSDDFGPAERAEAARALGHLYERGQTALADAIVTMLRDVTIITGDRFPVLLAAVTALGDRTPRTAEPAL